MQIHRYIYGLVALVFMLLVFAGTYGSDKAYCRGFDCPKIAWSVDDGGVQPLTRQPLSGHRKI